MTGAYQKQWCKQKQEIWSQGTYITCCCVDWDFAFRSLLLAASRSSRLVSKIFFSFWREEWKTKSLYLDIKWPNEIWQHNHEKHFLHYSIDSPLKKLQALNG